MPSQRFPENAGCIPSAVVIIHIFFISDLYRVLTEIAEVKTEIVRSVLRFIIPLLPKVGG